MPNVEKVDLVLADVLPRETDSDAAATKYVRPAASPTHGFRDGPLGHGTAVIRGAVDLLVLSVVSMAATTVDAVQRQIETLSTCQLSPADHVVYYSLERLRGWGWVELVESAADSRTHNRYRITPAGKRNLGAAHDVWYRTSSAANAIITASRQQFRSRRRSNKRGG